MVALKGKTIDAAIAKRSADYDAYLVYGPDQGLVGERALALKAHILTGDSDPFNEMDLSESDLKDDPSRLSDEIAALSFTGGERFIRVRLSGEAAGPAVPDFLKDLDAGHLKPNGIVVIEGGDLSKRSGLRQAFEKAKRAAALPCYADTELSIKALAQDLARSHGLVFENDALAFAAGNLGDDRGISRNELEKLMLYKSPGIAAGGEAATLTLDDVRICLVDAGQENINAVIEACLDGRPGPLDDALHRCAQAGTSAIAILRLLGRALDRLAEAQGFMQTGLSANEAMKKLRPPVFYAEQDAFRARLNRWGLQQLRQAKRHLIETELGTKTTGYPQRELVERATLRLCRMIRQR